MSTTPVPPSDADAVARLRALDPAADATADLDSLRAAVDARRAATAQDGPSAAGAPATTTGATDELAQARRRRVMSWPARAAAVAAAALVVGGGGGYAIGAAGDRPQTTASDAITLQGAGAGAESAELDAGRLAPGAGIADGGGDMAAAPDTAQGGAADSSYWGGYGRTVFSQSGLSTDGGTGTAWAFDPAAAFTQESVAAAAAALGVEGEPVLTPEGIWRVGAGDGTSPTIDLVPDGVANLSYYDPTKDPWMCGPDDMDENGGCTERDLGAAPQGDAATAALADVLRALGLDPAGFELRTEDMGEEDSWSYATAHHVVDGQRTGLQWGASFSGAGIQSLHGFLAPVVELGEYDVVSPAEAVERLGDARFGSGWGGPVAWVDGVGPMHRLEGDGSMPEPGPMTVPDPVAAGDALAWPVDEVQIVEARLGVASHTQPGGATLLVPTYELISDDGAIWTVIAVTEEHLDMDARG